MGRKHKKTWCLIRSYEFTRILERRDIMKIRKLKKQKTTCWWCPWMPRLP